MSDAVVLPVLDRKAHMVLAMLCKIQESETLLNMRHLSEELGMPRGELWDALKKLHGTVVTSFKGRDGGYKIIKVDATVAEVCALIGSTMTVPDTQAARLIRTGVSRIMRTTIQDLSERCA